MRITLPAEYMSWLISALGSTGLVLARFITVATMTFPTRQPALEKPGLVASLDVPDVAFLDVQHYRGAKQAQVGWRPETPVEHQSPLKALVVGHKARLPPNITG